LYLAQGDLEHAICVLEPGLTLCRASGDQTYLRGITMSLSAAYTLHGRRAEGHALLEDEISGRRLLGQALRSEVCRLMGRGDEARQYAHQALDLARQQKARGGEARALHQLGTVHAHADPPDVQQAETCYQQALTLAEELSMHPLQAHCHLGLGTLYTQTSRRTQARAELSAAIDLYRAMEMTFWLPQAEATLAHVEEGCRGSCAHCHSDFYQP
jgi:tetratricopeptide (TPR) repeat protein